MEDSTRNGPGRLLLAWSAVARRDAEAAGALLRDEVEDPRDRFYLHSLRNRAAVMTRDFTGADRELETMRKLSSAPEDELWLRTLAAEALMSQGENERAAAMLEEGRPRLDGAPVWLRASYLLDCALNAHRRGKTHEVLRDAREAQGIWRARGFDQQRLVALGSVSAAAFAEGNLPLCQQSVEDQLRDALRSGRWDMCLARFINLSLIHLERGNLGAARQAVRSGIELASRGITLVNLDKIRAQSAHVQCRTGRLEEGREAALRMVEILGGSRNYLDGHLRATLGEIELLAGQPERGRTWFRDGIDAYAASDSADSLLEAKIVWALRELETGGEEQAARLHAEIEPRLGEGTKLTRALFALLDGEVRRAILPSDARRLEEAVALLESQDRWYWAWRARWRLAQALLRDERPAEAAREYATARSILIGLVESLGSDSEPFLRLPGPDEFVRELTAVE